MSSPIFFVVSDDFGRPAGNLKSLLVEEGAKQMESPFKATPQNTGFSDEREEPTFSGLGPLLGSFRSFTGDPTLRSHRF